MTLYTRLDRLRSHSPSTPWEERILSELFFLSYLSSENGGRYDGTVGKASELLEKELNGSGRISDRVCREAEELLLPLANEAKRFEMHFVAHAHIDMNWLWGYEETASVAVNTLRTMLDLMDLYPDFTFSQSQASVYEIVEKFAPELLERIRARVAEGRFELSSCTWVEEDENMPCAESLIRQTVQTAKFYKKLFGAQTALPSVDFQPDTFGHCDSIPEICRCAGVKWLYHCRGRQDGPDVYVWRGKGGAELLCYRDPAWYAMDVSPDLAYALPGFEKRNGVPCKLTVYGVGDHGGGPTVRDIGRILTMREYPVFPTVLFSTYKAFFTELEGYREKLPRVEGEINFVFTGCYSSQSETKLRNRAAELRLYEAEFLAAYAGALTDFRATEGLFDAAWRKLLFCQFHDILPGSGVRATGEYASGCFQETMAAACVSAQSAMRAICDRIDLSSRLEPSAPCGGGAGIGVNRSGSFSLSVPSGAIGRRRAFHLFNTTAYDCDLPVRITVWDWDHDAGRAVFTDAQGGELPAVFKSSGGYWGHEYKVFLLKTEVPALGYTTVFLDEKEVCGIPAIGGFGNREVALATGPIVLENALVRALFDRRTGKLTEYTLKRDGSQPLKNGSFAFESVLEANHGMTAWKEGETLKSECLNDTATVRITGEYDTPLDHGFSYTMATGDMPSFSVQISLAEGETLLRCRVTVDYRARGDQNGIPRLQAVFHPAPGAQNCRYGQPYGTILRRPAPHDVPATYAFAPSDGAAAFVAALGKYGYRFFEDRLQCTLLRASFDPDPMPEYGVHTIDLAAGCIENAADEAALKAVSAFWHPAAVCPCQGKTAKDPKATLPPRGRFITIENAELLAVLPSDDGKATIVRFAALDDGDVRLSFGRPVSEAVTVDVFGGKESSLDCSGGALTIPAGKDRIVSVCVKFE